MKLLNWMAEHPVLSLLLVCIVGSTIESVTRAIMGMP